MIGRKADGRDALEEQRRAIKRMHSVVPDTIKLILSNGLPSDRINRDSLSLDSLREKTKAIKKLIPDRLERLKIFLGSKIS